MSKKEFLEKLRKRLEILDPKEIDDIIEEYEGHINEKVSTGKTEAEAIKDFGNFDELVKEILSAYKINEDYENKHGERNFITDFVDGCTNFIKDVSDNLSKRSKDDVIRFIIELIVLIIFIGILKLPVLLIQEMGTWVFEMLISPFGNALSFIWKYMIEIIYLVLAVVGIVNFVKKRYLQEEEPVSVNNNNSKEKPTDTKKSVNDSDVKKSSYNGDNSFSKVVLIILKVCLAFIIIPAMFSFAGSLVCLVIGIVLLCQGIPYLGMLLCCLTFVLLNYTFLDLCFRFILNKKFRLGAFIGSIISIVIIFAVGVSLSVYEVVNTTFIDGVDDIATKREIKKTIDYTDDSKLSCNYIRSYYNGKCNYVIDDTMQNQAEVTIRHYDYLDGIEFDENLRYYHKGNHKFSLKKIFNVVLKDLRKREFHNYEKLYEINTTIKVSSEVMSKISETDDQYRSHDYDYNYDFDYEKQW